MKQWIFLTLLSAALHSVVSAAEPGGEKLRFLTEKLGKSTVQVRYFFKNDDSGRKPPFEVMYYCNNCHDFHASDLSSQIENQLPVTVPGFLTGEKTIVSSDIGVLPGWIERIEIRQNGSVIPLAIAAYFPDQHAVELSAEKAVPGNVLQFQKAGPGEKCYHFTVTQENGIQIASVQSASAKVLRCLDNQTDYAVGGANTVLTDGDGNPVTLNFRNRRPLGKSGDLPPDQWRKVPASEYFQHLKAKAEELKKSFYPVHIRLYKEEQKQSIGFMRDDDAKNDFYCVGVLVAPELLLVPKNLDPLQTARLERVNVTLPDGKKADGKFAGSLRELGAFLVKVPAGGVPLKVTEDPLTKYFEETVYAVPARNDNGKLQLDLLSVLVTNFDEIRGGDAVPNPESYIAGKDFLLNTAGELLMIPATFRSVAEYQQENEGSAAQKIMAAVNGMDFDPENIPRSAEDRSVIAWFGADFQELTEELARVHHAVSQTENGENGLLISRVLPGSPAERAGFMTGDIVLYMRSADSSQRVELDTGILDMSFFDEEPFPWNQLDELPEQLFERLPTPWGSLETSFHKSLTVIGIGKEAIFGVIRKGEFSEKKIIVEKAPVHYENAPRFTAADLGMTVADPTFEVREAIRLASGSAGVIIAKVVPGSPAAVAGIKPYEVIVSVNGNAVFSAADFAKEVKDQKELVLSVRRMAAVRSVKINPGSPKEAKVQ